MKTIRTILATFGVTSLLYGLFAILSMRLDLTFTGRSIYQLFRETGFAALVLGIGCVLSFVIMTVALVAFREDGSRKKREIFEDEEDEAFLEEETVPAERAEEADETWSPEIKRKQRKALFATDEPEETPDLFGDDGEEPEEPAITLREESAEAEETQQTAEERGGTEETTEDLLPPDQKHCPYCGEIIDADSAFCNSCGRRV